MKDCNLYIVLIINGNKDIFGVYLLNRKFKDSFLYKINKLDK